MRFFLKLFPSRTQHDGNFASTLKIILGFTPKKLHLYRLAFKHRSSEPNATSSNNERLEFLGDAILSAIVADHLYQQYPEEDEGFLTSMRAKIVSRKNLNDIAKTLGLQEHIDCRLSNHKNAKSIGGDTLEALLGAIYLDQGIIMVKRFVLTRILHEEGCLDNLEQHIISYKGLVIEWAQKERKSIEFVLLEHWGRQHNKTFRMGIKIDEELLTSGRGTSKKRAEEEAARKAYENLMLSST